MSEWLHPEENILSGAPMVLHITLVFLQFVTFHKSMQKMMQKLIPNKCIPDII